MVHVEQLVRIPFFQGVGSRGRSQFRPKK